MKIRNRRSIIIIVVYLIFNVFILVNAFRQERLEQSQTITPGAMAPEYTEVLNLNYFHLKQGVPQLSLQAESMRSQGEEKAEFVKPQGVYKQFQKNQTLDYQANAGIYSKDKALLIMNGDVKLKTIDSKYEASKVKYYFNKDLLLGTGEVNFNSIDLKTKDRLQINAESMKAYPQNQFALFKGGVQGSIERKKKYEGRMTFSSQQLQVEGLKSHVQLEGDVQMKRDSFLITAGKGDLFLENYNKSLKYFVFNDDVKVTEKMAASSGPINRKAFAERLEGFGVDGRMVLSGAPRVEQGKDIVKGYRITIRENMEFIEVDDAMSDMQIKKTKD